MLLTVLLYINLYSFLCNHATNSSVIIFQQQEKSAVIWQHAALNQEAQLPGLQITFLSEGVANAFIEVCKHCGAQASVIELQGKKPAIYSSPPKNFRSNSLSVFAVSSSTVFLKLKECFGVFEMTSECDSVTQFLLVIAQEKFGYALPELESIGQCCGIDLDGKLSTGIGSKNLQSNDESSSPILIVSSASEDQIKKLLSRSVLVKDAYELWGFGTTLPELKEAIKGFPSHLKERWFDCKTFAVRVKGVGKKVSLSQQISTVESLEDIIPFRGKVDLNNPLVEMGLIEDFSERNKGQPPKEPLCLYLGRHICSGQRKLIGHYSLKKRKFIGNTSMDSMLGMIMANLACVRPNTLTCDPFVGTGSLLISAAHFGSYVIGADISYNILHAKGKSSRRGAGWRQKDETIRHSLKDYGREAFFVDALVADAANNPWRLETTELFDAIVTDPPYGIREACSRVGSKNNNNVTQPDLAPGQIHFPEQKAYHLDDVFKDLLTFAVRSLVVGGRLVYWLPVYKKDYSPDVIPAHPSLKLLYNCEQMLNGHSARRLIVMEKLKLAEGHDFKHISHAFINSTIFCGHNAFRGKYFKQ